MTHSTAPGKLTIFCDFDGTIARADVGYQLFRHFSGGRNEELIPDWKAGKISSREILEREADMVNAPAGEILTFIDQFSLDPTFTPFARRCQRAGVPLFVVSEGMDVYIKRLLQREGLDDIPVICNIGRLEQDRIFIDFPHVNRHCTRCGSCKGERIEEYRAQAADGAVVAFIGDGYSDACAAREADILFAKKDLEHYCQSENIPYNWYDTFDDVTNWLVSHSMLDD